eukprot:gene30224-35213_t
MSQPPPSHRASDGLVLGEARKHIDELTRKLSVSGNSEGEMLRNLRSMNLGDDFWIYGFKVTPCTKSYSHKWSFCPCGHEGETGRRRDPRTVPYKPDLCPLAKAKKNCPLGEHCLLAHNVFEHWLHPARYKTRLCTFGPKCNRPICFFAHNAEEMRVAPKNDGDDGERPQRKYGHSMAGTSDFNNGVASPSLQPHPAMTRSASARYSWGGQARAMSPAMSGGYPTMSSPYMASPTMSSMSHAQFDPQQLDLETSALLMGLPLLGINNGSHSASELQDLSGMWDSYAPYGSRSSGQLDMFCNNNNGLINHGLNNNGHNSNGLNNNGHNHNVHSNNVHNNNGHSHNGHNHNSLNNIGHNNNGLNSSPLPSWPPNLDALNLSTHDLLTHHAPPVRLSDPGFRMMPGISPLLQLDRISEGGNHHRHGSANGSSSNPHLDFDANMESILGSLSLSHQLNSDQDDQQQQQQQHLNSGTTPPFTPGGMPNLSGPMPPSRHSTPEVENLVAQLQVQGLGNTKEEVVASLSSLLSQLLSVE